MNGRRTLPGLRTVAALAMVVLGAGPVGVAASDPTPDGAASHWAYQPLRRQAPPAVRATADIRTPVDAFLLSRLEDADLGFAPPADPRTLLRRLSHDLIGLPPTAAEVEEFALRMAVDPDQAVADTVDRLLADPRYGERWGRHWLDVARYADTKDLVLLYGRDALRPYAYTYRDYVVRAFNDDLPYDAFIRDQLAADLLGPDHPRWRLAALGFLTLGRLFDLNVHDQIDDQIDTVTRGLLGLTVSCARCHDHKYDAVGIDEYYGLYGVFASTEQPHLLPLIEDPADVPGGQAFEERLAKALGELEGHIDAEFTRLTADFRRRIGDYLVRAVTTEPDLTETAQFGLSLIPEDFRPTLMLRTRRHLAARIHPADRVYGPWAAWRAQAAGNPAPEPPDGGWNPLVVGALRRAAPADESAVARAYGDLLVATHATATAADAPSPGPDARELLDIVAGPDGPLWFPRRHTPDHMSRPEKDRYHQLRLALDKVAIQSELRPPARAMVVADLPEAHPTRVFLRGSPARPGPVVPRALPRILTGGVTREFGPGSGRLDLARAIASPTNPLTARVWVNRVWMQHFGEPLVASPADFGTRSDPPTHPELLDWLAASFIDSGWSVKHLHRLMLLSAAFRQGSRAPAAEAADPDNRLLGRYPRRRLDLEAFRDSLLAVAGRLDPTTGGPAVDVAGDPLNRRRTLYGLVDRQNLPDLYRAFDFAAPDQCVERRPRTTVPQQALFVLNSPFIHEQARALARHPEVLAESSPDRRLGALFRRAWARGPTAAEANRAREFLETAVVTPDGPDPWEQLAHVLLAANELVFID